MSGIQALSAIENRPTAVVIADQLREGIITGAFKPGDQINEAQVAGQLNVSRGPVREALHRLVQEGLLLSRPNRGVFVQEISIRDVAEVNEAREVLECAAAEIISKRSETLRKATADRLRAKVDEMHAALDTNDWQRLGRIDLEFHTLLIADSENTRLARAYSTLATEALICLSNFLPEAYPETDLVIPSHLKIAQLVEEGDMESIHTELHEHLSIDGYELHSHDDDGSLRHGRNEDDPTLTSA